MIYKNTFKVLESVELSVSNNTLNKKEKEIENLETFLLSLNDSLEHEFTFDQQLAILQVSFSQFFKLYINIIYRIETTQALLFVLQVCFFLI